MSQVLRKNEETGQYEWVDGQAAGRDSRGTSCQTFTESKPHFSDAMGCLPHQVADFNAQLEKEGLSSSLHYMPDGRLRATSKSALNTEMRRRGFLNADAGYSDYAGR